MILLYTGAKSPNGIQTSSEKSLGGYISSTNIPNGRLGNLFSGISKSVIINKTTEIRMIALKNTTGSTINGLKLYTNANGKSFDLKIAAVSPGTNSCNESVFEEVLDGQSLPYQAILSSHEGEVNALVVGTVTNNQVIGIWVYREIDATKYPELIPSSPLTDEQLITAIQAQSTDTEEELQLIIKWD